MSGGGVPGLAVAAAAGGVLLTWSGLTGAKVTDALRSVISGKQPAGGANTITAAYDASQSTGGSTTAGSGSSSAAPAVSGTYTTAQLKALWASQGGSAATAANAACHAMQESAGNPGATSPNPDGGTNVGLWQLDTPGGIGAGYTVAQLKDPATNARVTVMATHNGTAWGPWATPGC